MAIHRTETESMMEWGDTLIAVRNSDGYVNATAICKANGKRWNDYMALDNTIGFIHSLSDKLGIPMDVLIQSKKGGIKELQGTWVHRLVAYDLAAWADPVVFRVEMICFLDSVLGTNIDTTRNGIALPTDTTIAGIDAAPIEHLMSDEIPIQAEAVKNEAFEHIGFFTKTHTELVQNALAVGELTDSEKRRFASMRKKIVEMCVKAMD